MKKIYFVGLNELRAIAAFSVLVYHIELYKKREHIFGHYNTFLRNIVESIGHNGVNLFFVLSGFLITYLLIEEKEKNNKIEIKKFYIRRVLRIWPLYYLIMALSFFFLPFAANHLDLLQNETFYFKAIQGLSTDFWYKLLVFVSFLPNLALPLGYLVPGASQAWSVGVEEQYYLFWPVVIDKIKKTNWVLFFICFIIIKMIIDFWLMKQSGKSELFMGFHLFSRTFKIELMAIGALGAYYSYYHNEKIIPLAKNNILAALNYFIILLCLHYGTNHVVLGFLFLFAILSTVNYATFTLKNSILDDMGKISYGIYMYHPIIVFFSFAVVNKYVTHQNLWLYNICLYSLIIGVTVLVSKLSYKYFETYFLKLKSKGYTVIESGS